MNGMPVGRRFEQVSQYVAQEEMFVPTLSCWETLHIHAALRNRSGASAQELDKRMQDVLSVMGLWRARDTQVTRLVSVAVGGMPYQTADRASGIRQAASRGFRLPCFTTAGLSETAAQLTCVIGTCAVTEDDS